MIEREPLLRIVHEDSQLLVLNKPAGLVCHPTKTDEYSSLVSRVRLYLGDGARFHLVNRLDRETSGLTLVALGDDVARQVRQLWEKRQVQKRYLAIVHGHVTSNQGVIEASLGKDEKSRVAIKDCVRLDGAPARTEYQVQRRFTYQAAPGAVPIRASVLSVLPQTGRKHQIRIHLAHIGHPIIGDKLYGGDEDLYLALVEDRLTPEQKERLILPHHALHASEVSFLWQGKPLEFRAEPETWFQVFATWGHSISCTSLLNSVDPLKRNA